MQEPTPEELINYIAAAFTFYEQIRGRGYAPTNKQIQAMLAACGVRVTLDRIQANREIIRELEQQEKSDEDTYAED
jgi:hypothetical protein